MKNIMLVASILLLWGCGHEVDRHGKIALGFTITDTLEALVGVPMEDLKRSGKIEVLVYDFSRHNEHSYMELDSEVTQQTLYFFRFKNETLIKFGPVKNARDMYP